MIRFMLLSVLVVGCGDSDSGSKQDPDAAQDAGEILENGEYRYAFISEQVNYVCSDGSTGTNPPVSMNLGVIVSGNEVSIARDAEGREDQLNTLNLSGFESYNATDLSGLIQVDGNFVANQTASAVHSELDNIRVGLSLTGKIGSKAWFGNYEYTLTISETSEFCDFSTTFSGKRQTP